MQRELREKSDRLLSLQTQFSALEKVHVCNVHVTVYQCVNSPQACIDVNQSPTAQMHFSQYQASSGVTGLCMYMYSAPRSKCQNI